MTDQLDLRGLEKVRQRMLLTQEGIASLLGITRQTYNNWIRGRSRPRGAQRDRLRATLLDISRLIETGRWPAPGVRAKDPGVRLALLIAEIKASNGEEYGSIHLSGEGIT